jgi:glycosyltransferase involved in cell wall biosynthesis
MERFISVVIPNYNKAATIGKCLEALFSSNYENFEVIVVDDCSEDNSVEIIEQYPCKLIRLERRSGTSKARNIGAYNSSGDFVFFTDADCLLQNDTLSIVNKSVSISKPDIVIGGTYTMLSYDKSFFSIFQSVFVNYSETKYSEPDYIAAHAMIIDARTFRKSGGFPEDFLPIIEDVEFSHRLRRSGYRFIMNPEIQVQHIFNFTLWRSLCNAFKKTKYWNIYSLNNRDLFADSGAASVELKANVISLFSILLLLVSWLFFQKQVLLYPLPLILLLNTFISRRLLHAFYEAKGILFACQAFIYYIILWPFPIGMGTITGIMEHLFFNKKL